LAPALPNVPWGEVGAYLRLRNIENEMKAASGLLWWKADLNVSHRSREGLGFMYRGTRSTILFFAAALALTVSIQAKTRVNSAASRPIDKHVQSDLNAAVRDMKRAGIKPKLTSTFRTTAEQSRLYRCGQSRHCKERRGVYGAKKPGTSMHEAGFAVDIAGVARKQHGRRKVTPQGQRVISIMNKHGFRWRYGLKDPAHFEADPTKHGFRSVNAAIKAHQTRGNRTYTAKASSRKRPSIIAVKSSEKRRPPRRRTDA